MKKRLRKKFGRWNMKELRAQGWETLSDLRRRGFLDCAGLKMVTAMMKNNNIPPSLFGYLCMCHDGNDPWSAGTTP